MEQEEEPGMGQRCQWFFKYHWRGILSVVFPLILLPIIFLDPVVQYRCLYLLIVMAVFWITEAIPISMTSIMPVIFLPPMGILTSEIVCLSYFNDAVLTCMGAIIVALTIEYCNLHTRVALAVLMIVGTNPRRLHLVVILFTMFASMWFSNASTTAILCPIIKAILEQLQSAGVTTLTTDEEPSLIEDPPYPSNIVICFYLGMAYTSSIGGCGTLMGTETNTIFLDLYNKRFPKQTDIKFGNWMMFNILPMLLHTLLLYIWMEFQFMGLFRPNSAEAQEINAGNEGADLVREMVTQRRSDLGSLNCHEIQVSIFFFIMVVLFFTSKPVFMSGWTEFFNAKIIKNSFSAMFAVIIYFALPVNYVFMKYWICKKPDPEEPLPSLISWKFVHANFPWSVLLILGGGYALSKGVQESGLSKSLDKNISGADSLSPPLLQFVCILIAIATTTLTANIAMCSMLMPILQEMAIRAGMHPLLLTLPTTVALSMAFFMPVSTAPNAIVGAFGNIRTKTMFKAGFVPTLIVIIGLFIFSQTWIRVVYSQVNDFPTWGNDPKPKSIKF